MKRISRPSGNRRRALLAAFVLLAVPSASVAAAHAGSGPLGVTVAAPESARVGALFAAESVGHLAGQHFCTASVVHAPQRDLLVTAAHCLEGIDATDLVFVPAYKIGKAPYGVWHLERRFLPDGWAQRQDEDSDIAFVVVAPLHGEDVEDVVGANRFVTGTTTGATAVTVTGYPNTAEAPIVCTNKPSRHSSTQQRIACPSFTGGTSGSPWVNGDHEVVGVLGGHEQGGATADISYSVVLGTEAAELYREATADPS